MYFRFPWIMQWILLFLSLFCIRGNVTKKRDALNDAAMPFIKRHVERYTNNFFFLILCSRHKLIHWTTTMRDRFFMTVDLLLHSIVSGPINVLKRLHWLNYCIILLNFKCDIVFGLTNPVTTHRLAMLNIYAQLFF